MNKSRWPLTPLRWPATRPRTTLLIAGLITVLSVWSISRFHADTSLENLLPKTDPAAQAMVRSLNDFAAVDELLVLVSSPVERPPESAALSQYAERLKGRIDSDAEARGLIDSVTYRVDDEAQQFVQHVIAPAGLFYLDDQALAAAKARLTRPAMDQILRQNEAMLAAPGPAAGALAATLLQDPLHLHDFLQQQLLASQPTQIASSSGLLLSRDQRSLLIRLSGKRPVSDLDYSKAITRKVEVLLRSAQPENLQIDLTGGYAIAAASEKAIRHDMTSSITGSVILLQLLFIVAYRQPIRFFLLAFIPVGIGIVWGFGVRALLWPALSPTAAVVGGILAGLGTDYTIQFLSNFQTHQLNDVARSVEITSRGMAGTLFTAWLTSVIGFGVVGFSSIAVLRDFALVGSLGLLGALLATFTVLPALLVLLQRKRSGGDERLRFDVLPLLQWISLHRRLALGLVCLLGVSATVIVAWPGVRLPLDPDLTSMHPRPNPPLDAEEKVARVMGVSPGSVLVYLSADSDADLIHLSHEVAHRLASPSARAAGVTGTFGLANLLPDPDRQIKPTSTVEADKIVTDFKAAVDASNFDPTRYEPYAIFLHLLLTNDHVPSVSDLARYPQLAKSMVSRAAMTGTAKLHESITLLFTDRDLNLRSDRVTLIDAVRRDLNGLNGATLTGLSVVGLDSETVVHDQLPRLLVISTILIGLTILLHFRSLRDTLLAFSPTLFSLLVLMALARLTGQTLNMMNLLVIPLLMGVDTDYGIFLIGLTRHAAGRQSRREMAASFYALGISAAAAALGFGSLAFTSVPAIRSLGWAMGVGSEHLFRRDAAVSRADAFAIGRPAMITPSLPGLAVSFFAGGGIPIAAMPALCFWPSSTFWGPVISRGSANDRGEIALTFDDGPDGEFTPRVLDTLGEHGISAAFFVIGRNVERFPSVVERMHREGHVVGNHTWDHDHHGYLGNARYWRAQLDRTDAAIEQIIGLTPALFRPPMGIRTGHIMRAADRHTVITWTRRGMDGVATTPDKIVQRLGPRTESGEIVVLHDGVEPHSRRSPAATCEALPTLLRQWKDRGLRPQRLDQWLDRSAYARQTSGTR